MKYFKKNIPIYISLLLTAVFIISVYFQLDEAEMRMFINSDTLYLPSFFRDLFYDKSRNVEWFTPAATCFFPDLILFFTVHLFTCNFIKAMFFTGLLMNILLIMAFYLLIKESLIKITPLYISIGINLLLLFHFATLYAGDYIFSFYLTITNYHLGAYIASLFCLYYAVRYLKTSKPGNLAVMVLLYTFTISSDFLTVVYLTIPLLSSIILFFKRKYRMQSSFILLSNILGFTFGFLFYRVLTLSKALNIMDASYLTFNFKNIAKSYAIMFEHHFLFLKTMDVRAFIFVLCIISFTISVVILIKKLIKFFRTDNIEKNEIPELVYLLFIVTQVIALYNAPAINGVYLARSLLRYNVYVFFITMLNYGYLFYKLSMYEKFRRYVYIISTVVLIFFSYMGLREIFRVNFKEGAQKLFGYYPDYVRNIDEICLKFDLKYGLAGYWQARRTSMLSKQDVRIYQTYFNLRPYPHVVNYNWYFGTKDGKKPPPVFQFVIPDELTDSIVYQKLDKHIIDTINRPDVTMIVTDPFIIDRETKNLIFIDQ